MGLRCRFVLSLLAAPLCLVACGSPSAPTAGAPTAKTPPHHWSYEGAEGPKAWGQLDPAFAACENGHEQSPIDLPVAKPGSAPPAPKLIFAYAAAPLRVAHNGHAALAEAEGHGGRILVDGEPFELVQFHVHTPSEHTFGGAGTALEIHLVHKDARGNLAVVGLLARQGSKNAALAPFFEHLPASGPSPGKDVPGAPTVDIPAIVAGRHAYDAYDGSLTTPPCGEHVRWFVLEGATEVSAEQLDAVHAADHGDNARPVQPLGARIVRRAD